MFITGLITYTWIRERSPVVQMNVIGPWGYSNLCPMV